jgi:hypothetical protein
MKKTLIYILFATLSIVIVSCKKTSPGDNYDFSNSLPPYVTLSSKSISVSSGTSSAKVSFNMRTALEQDVTITYNLTGIVNANNQTLVIPKETTIASASIARPTTGATTGTATLTVVKAVKVDGTALTIGQNNVASSQVATITFK